MDSGFFTSAIGMLDGFNVENNISDNLANLQTPGFKERTPVLSDFSKDLYNSQLALGVWPQQAAFQVGTLGQAPQIASYGLNLAQGNPKYTGSPLDIMLVGNAFFRVRNGGATLLTRNGSLHRDAAGHLMTPDGYSVLGTNGQPLVVPSGTLEVSRDGVLRVDGKQVGQLALAQVPVGRPLAEAGGGYFAGPGQAVSPRAQGIGVLQGYLETSNVDMASQMSQMLSAQRAYQADSQMLQMQDSSMSLAVNDLGKLNA